MVHHRSCSYEGCGNYTSDKMKNVRLFKFPFDDARRKEWILRTGNSTLKPEHLISKYVCSDHFAPEYFTDSRRKYLLKYALPTPYDDGCMEVVTNQEVDESSVMDNVKQELCRVCGSKDNSVISIFETTPIENTHHFSLVKMLELYLPLKIQEDDNLPSKICSKCLCMVNQWHELYITCVAADKTFRRMYCKGNLEGNNGEPVSRLEDEVVHFTICNESSMDDPILKMKENVNENDYSRRSKSDGNIGNNCDNSKDVTSCTFKNDYLSTSVCDSNVTKNCDQSKDVTFCAGTISEEEKLKYPEIRTYQVPLVSCRICCNIFDDRSSWRSHHQACKDSLTICEECGKIIPRKYLKRHKSQYHSAKKLCDKCGEKFYPRFLSYHMLSHHSETYYCELCWKILKTKLGLQKHLIRHQNGEIKTAYKVKTLRKEDKVVFVCPVCNLSFDDKRSLIIHLNKSINVKCPVCKLVLNNEKLLYRHKCKKLCCQYCSRSFYHKTTLMGHERTHTGETPYKCNICNQSFKTACVRSAHRRFVHGEPTHECKYCSKKYYLPSHLRYHMDMHEGVRFPCPLCAKPLKRSESLRKHIKLHIMGRI